MSEFAPEKTIPVAFWLAAASLIVSGVAVIIMFLPIYGWLAVVFAFIAFGLAIMSDRVAAYQNTPGKLPAIAVAFTLAIFVIALGLTINALNRLNDVRERF